MSVHQIWNKIPKDSLKRLYDGMIRRADALMIREDMQPIIRCSVNYLIRKQI